IAYRGGAEARLVAYVVPAAEQVPETADLREHLRSLVPDYMLPGGWVFLPALPLTPNGKIDRRALPSPERMAAPTYEPPQSALERTIAEAWQELLSVDRVGLHDNFFDLGGHSLLVPRLQARLRASLGREISMIDLFSHPTVVSLARRLSGDDGQEQTRARTE